MQVINFFYIILDMKDLLLIISFKEMVYFFGMMEVIIKDNLIKD